MFCGEVPSIPRWTQLGPRSVGRSSAGASQHSMFLYNFSHPLTLLLQIRWNNHFRRDAGLRCKVSVDGTDYRLQQQYPPKEWYSHKFKTLAYRYELAVCIRSGDIVHVHGPFKPGLYNDLLIFRYKLKRMLLVAGERLRPTLAIQARSKQSSCQTREILNQCAL